MSNRERRLALLTEERLNVLYDILVDHVAADPAARAAFVAAMIEDPLAVTMLEAYPFPSLSHSNCLFYFDQDGYPTGRIEPFTGTAMDYLAFMMVARSQIVPLYDHWQQEDRLARQRAAGQRRRASSRAERLLKKPAQRDRLSALGA